MDRLIKKQFQTAFPKGFGMIELLAAMALAIFIIPGMLQFSFSMTRIINGQERRVEAAYLAEEGIEAVRTMRDRSWSTTIAGLTLNTDYYPTIQSNVWSLSLTDPGVLLGRYTRTVKLQSVNRDTSSDIVVPPAVGGVEDAETRFVSSTVSWTEPGGAVRSLTLQAYLTNFLAN
ncbi:MAG: type II secretion system protein [Patescibacteria group bacterium]|jgi:type II secretory pathway pseudopilin PulG